MLAELNIRNLALIETLHVELEPGLNVFTGETGAGKSILINAIGLVVGDRGSLDLVKTGAGTAVVEALLRIKSRDRAVEVLQNLGIDLQSESPDVSQPKDKDNGEYDLLVSREFGGRNRCRVNGRLATVQMLKEIGQAYVDIHGQHEHQSLLRPQQHLEFLDLFGADKVRPLRESVREIYRSYRELNEAIRLLTASERERTQRIDLLQFQVREIEAAHLRPDEESLLRDERVRLTSAERLREAASRVVALLSNDPDGRDVLGALRECVATARDSGEIDSAFQAIQENLETALFHLDDANEALRSYLENLDADPQRLEEVESRLHLLHQLKKKYGDDVYAILDYRESAVEELERLTHSDERLSEFQQQRERVEKDLAAVTEQLSQARRDCAKAFRKAILSHLKDVAMEKACFEVRVERQEDSTGILMEGRRIRVGEKGCDEVEFLISPNPGQPLKPLARIASGGELSRVMLALKSALTRRHEIPTLVFDEIDAGIGGATAKAVGEKLKHLSQYAQVLCVTHLPQIACLADAHFLVTKVVSDTETSVHLRRLTEEERVEEIARLLGGDVPSTTARKHAREMLARGK